MKQPGIATRISLSPPPLTDNPPSLLLSLFSLPALFSLSLFLFLFSPCLCHHSFLIVEIVLRKGSPKETFDYLITSGRICQSCREGFGTCCQFREYWRLYCHIRLLCWDHESCSRCPHSWLLSQAAWVRWGDTDFFPRSDRLSARKSKPEGVLVHAGRTRKVVGEVESRLQNGNVPDFAVHHISAPFSVRILKV